MKTKTLKFIVIPLLAFAVIVTGLFAWQYSKYDITAKFDGYEQRAPFERGYGTTLPIIRPTTRYALISRIQVANPDWCLGSSLRDKAASLAINDNDLHTVLGRSLVLGKTYRFQVTRSSADPDQRWSLRIN